jgi:ornithine cyclodeaminase
MPPMPLLLTESDVRALLPIDHLIATMETALADFSLGRVLQPLRTVLQVPTGSAEGDKAFYGVMPAYLPRLPALGTKMVTVFGSNAERNLPSHLATITLLDPETGALLALVDGRFITEARTAAVSAVSVNYLAKPDAGVLALIGSGVQARSHLEAIDRVRELRDVRVWSRSSERRGAFASEMGPRVAAPVRAVDSAEEAVHGASIVVLVTAAREPVVRNEWIADGAHICAVGACRPDQREMEASLVARGELWVDSRVGALSEAGDILLAIKEGAIDESHIAGELGEFVASASRRKDDRLTIFKSLGMAVEDIAAAHLAFVRARQAGRGQTIEL